MDSKKLRLAALNIVLDLARKHVAEQGGNNRGLNVDPIIRYAQGQVGEPWCVDTVIYAYGHAGSKYMRPGSPRAVRLMVQPGVHVTKKAAPGCPVRYIFDHTGLLVGWRRQVGGKFVRCPRWLATHIMAVEGNTSASGSMLSDSRNGGDGVYYKIRPLSVVQDFLYVTG
jgi:hypothetical protein